jgi:crossover junction endodeoxyribonuclease RuvC
VKHSFPIRILGIDPGTQVMGYGLIDVMPTKCTFVDCGFIMTKPKEAMSQRLKTLFLGVEEIVRQFSPDEFAIEDVFMNKDPRATIKLGQARGVAICAAALANLPVSDYSPRLVKKSVVGYGAADKLQMQQMIKILLKLPEAPQSDSADALAVALHHGHQLQTSIRLTKK